MDTGHVEHGERDVGGRHLAGTSRVMAKVEDSAEFFERHAFKMSSGPVLRQISIRVIQVHR
jgi:hypothetical protein